MRSGVRMVFVIAALIFATPVLLFGANVKGTVSADGSAARTVASTVPGGRVWSGSADGDGGESQPATPTQSGRVRAGRNARVELFLGYSYLRAVPTLAAGNRLVWLHGGSTSVAFNLNHFLGLVGDFGGFADSELNLTGPGANPERIADSGGNAFTYLFGPRFSYRRHERFVPFAQVLFGGIHASPVTLSGCTGTTCIPLPSQNAFALTAGGGLDLKIHHHLSLRLVQAEYLMTRFADPMTGDGNTQNDIRLSAGLVIGMGGGPAFLPVTYTCAAMPLSAYAGDPVSINGTALNLNPKRTPTYGWKVDGGKISGTTEVAQVDTSGMAPGNYTAQGHVGEGAKPGHFADCSAPFTIAPVQPPTISCSAAPSTAHPGDAVTITSQGMSPQNRPLTYSYSASDGSIRGNGTTAALTTGTIPETISVTCTVTDDKGQTGVATTTAMIVAPPAPAPVTPQTLKLCSISFERDTSGRLVSTTKRKPVWMTLR